MSLLDAILRWLIPALFNSLLLSIVRIWRDSRARRRHQAIPYDITVRIPVRLRGADRRYPGLFRMGWFDQATGWWRPSLRWGAPVNLAGGHELRSWQAAFDDAVPVFLLKDIVLERRDRYGTLFQVLVMEEDVSAVRMGMTKAPQSDTAGWWQRLQTVVSPSAILCLLAGLGWLVWVPGDLAVAWVLGTAIAFWIAGAAVVVTQYWYRWHLARTDWSAPRIEPVAPSEVPIHIAVEELPRRKPDL
jgi:hypothetical protein